MAINNKIYTESLQVLLDWFQEFQEAKHIAAQNKVVHISPEDLKKANDLKDVLDKLLILEAVQLIKHYATQQYSEIDNYVAERLTTLTNALKNAELELNNVMARNNNQDTPYSERLKKQMDKIRTDISIMESLKSNPSALISYILDKYKYVIDGNVDRLIRDMISSDAYIQTHQSYFVEDKKDGLIINEANILLALEVLNGRTDHYEYLRELKDSQNDIKKTRDISCPTRVSNFVKLLDEYRLQLNKMNYARSQIDVKYTQFRHNYFPDNDKKRAQASLNSYDIERRQAIDALSKLLVAIRSELEYFISIGCEFDNIDKIRWCLSIKDPDKYQQLPLKIDASLHRKLLSKVWDKREERLTSLKEKEAYASSQIPDDLKDADSDSVMHMMIALKSKVPYDWETTQMALTTLLIVSGFKNNVLYESLTSSDEKRALWDRIRDSSREFLNNQKEADGMHI